MTEPLTRPCWWCQRHGMTAQLRRYSGWWARLQHWKRFRPCCSHHAGQVVGTAFGVIERRKT